MATNFEFYKNRIKAGFKREYAIHCLTEAIEEAIEVKMHKECGDSCAECVLNTIEWLLAEHIEQPKLTKRERAFCEAVQAGFISRDCDMQLCYYTPDSCGECAQLKELGLNEFFMFIRDIDEKPWAVEDLLKLEVMEE